MFESISHQRNVNRSHPGTPLRTCHNGCHPRDKRRQEWLLARCGGERPRGTCEGLHAGAPPWRQPGGTPATQQRPFRRVSENRGLARSRPRHVHCEVILTARRGGAPSGEGFEKNDVYTMEYCSDIKRKKICHL